MYYMNETSIGKNVKKIILSSMCLSRCQVVSTICLFITSSRDKVAYQVLIKSRMTALYYLVLKCSNKYMSARGSGGKRCEKLRGMVCLAIFTKQKV